MSVSCAQAQQSALTPLRPSAPSPNYVRVIRPFDVRDEHGNAYSHPFIGGFDVPRPQFFDIDGDGDLDLFIQERSNELMFFENVGTATTAKYEWRTDKYQNLDIGEWNRFIDLDKDGDYDLLAEQQFSYIKYFRNDGTSKSASFKLAADSLRDGAGKAIFADRQNIPNLADIDCDGKVDLFLGRVEGTITRYEALDEARPNAIPRFGFVTDRFEDIEIIGVLNGSAIHGANTMFWSDADNDGDIDLFWGDFFEQGVLYLQNASTNCSAPNLRVEPAQLMVDGTRFLTSGYNVPILADIDGDKDRDMFIGVLGGAFNPNNTASDNFYFLEQTADRSLKLRSKRFIDGIDVGSESVPAFGDLDGDGDLDLLVGNKLDVKHQETGRLYLFKNTGTATKPSLALTDTLTLVTQFHQAPALGDLDGDGDLDLVLGTWNDGVFVFRNVGTKQAPKFVQDSAATIRFTRGSNFIPTLADIDGDGDLDMLVGEGSGEINLVRNTGTKTAPQFKLEDEVWQGIDAGRRSKPALADLDGDGDLDMIIGREDAGSVYYKNEGSRTQPKFVLDPSFQISFHHNATPIFADIDGDGDVDLFSGSLGGGLAFWENRSR